MKKLISEISRIKQMMGIFESLEDDKKISDEYIEFIKNTSIDDQLGKDKERSLEIRQKYYDVRPRNSVYEKIKNSTSLDELRNLFSKDYEFKDNVRNNFCGDEEIDGIIEVLCILNGGSNEGHLGKEGCNWHRIEFSKNLTIDTNLLDLIPGLKEKALKLKRISSANKIKSNFENTQTNIKNTQTNIEKNKSTISADQYISKLNYSDVGYDNVDAGGSMKKYSESLAKEDPNEVESLVKSLISRFKNLMTTKVNKEISRAGMSESWAYWDVGKQLYFYNNPEESNYKLGNPLTDKWIQQSIINRMIGWEVTNGGKKPNGNKYSSKELANIGETYL